MACNCRTAALRLFVRGFAQLHISEPAAAAASLRQSLRPTPRTPSIAPCRGIYSSAPCRGAQVTAAAEAPSTPSSIREDSKVDRVQGDMEAADGAATNKSPEVVDTSTSEISSDASHQSIDAARGHASALAWTEFEDGDMEDFTIEYGKKGKKEGKKKKTAALGPSKQDKAPPPRAAKRRLEPWQVQKQALAKKFGGEGWNPRKRLSPDALEGIRALHKEFPKAFTTEVLAAKFEVSPEAIRRILKSKWRPSSEEEEERERRWFDRGKKIWERNAELGMRVPRTWRNVGVKNQRRPKPKPRPRDDFGGLNSPYR